MDEPIITLSDTEVKVEIEKPKRKIITPILTIVGIIFCIFVGYIIFIPSFGFQKQNPNGVYLDIKSGMSARQVANMLYSNKVISSPTLFVGVITLLRDQNNISSGIYFIREGQSIYEAEQIIVNADYGIESKKITFPEGFTNRQIADRLFANLPNFDRNTFLNLASTTEGYLYPETYFLVPSDSASAIYQKMRDTFDSETETLSADLIKSGRSLNDVVIMASILEREVKSKEDKQMVASILWNRIKNKMALQVDATLAYERNKDSYTLTTADLRADSPYNTYTRRGLPPTAISNPGFDSIYAALNPIPNNYVYFLTDREGNVYYARAYEEHLKNKAKYL